MQYTLCLDTLNLPYDKEKMLNDKNYRLNRVDELSEKYEGNKEYKNWSILRYWWVNGYEKNQRLLQTDKYIKIQGDYEKQFEKERQERESVFKSISKSVPKSLPKSLPKLAVEVENNQLFKIFEI
jgi:inorganic triphosphatase YgiF